MAGYSGTPLEKKLGVRDGTTTFLDGAPPDFTLQTATTRRLPKRLDLGLTFHIHEATLRRRFGQLEARLHQDGTIWVCWPKKAAQKQRGIASDLDENVVRAIGLHAGLVDVKVAAIDETWSALKFVRRLQDR